MRQEYITYLRDVRQLPAGTLKTYENGLTDFISFAQIFHMTWTNTSREFVEAWAADLGRRGQKPATIKNKMAAVRGIFQFMMQRGWRHDNPARFVPTPKIMKTLPKTCELEQVEKFIESTSATREERGLKALTALLVDTGIRISEALNLKREDFDRKTRSFIVNGKGGKERRIYYGERVGRMLSYYVRAQHGYIFDERDDKKIRFDLYAATAPYMEKCHPHMLRHTYATHMLNAGCEIKTLSQLLGHESVKTTERYAQANNANCQKAQQNLHPLK